MDTIDNKMKLMHGRPSDNGRLAKETATYDLLYTLDIPFERVDHRAAGSYDDCEDIESVLGVEICKNLFLCTQSKTDFYLLMMPGRKKFVTKDVSKQIGSSRLSFADAAAMEKYLNITPGSVSVLGLMNDTEHKVRLLIDNEIAESEYVGCHPCINTSSLKIRTKDIFERFLTYTGHKPLIVELRDPVREDS
ncbi:MAG TPA: prolyl-tRNA synthetase associated domain-containing protein [Clostridia bacterium]|nr:prolyl-tRNA synthetase associated domain-containing protein [Clostridia bacterium]